MFLVIFILSLSLGRVCTVQYGYGCEVLRAFHPVSRVIFIIFLSLAPAGPAACRALGLGARDDTGR